MLAPLLALVLTVLSTAMPAGAEQPANIPTVGWLVFEHLVTWAEAERVQEGWREQCRTRTTEFCRTPSEAGFKGKLGCHVFRATGITAHLEAGGALENAQAMAAHESPRTTKLYDRTGDEITLDEVERINI
jgi:hypothetical protein